MASTLLSPGVEIQERDLTVGSIETVEVNVGAIAGAFQKGPVLKPVRIASESQLIETFGEPTDDNADEWWVAASFLQYGGVLDVVRCSTTGQLTASDDNVTSPYTLSIPTLEHYEANEYLTLNNPFKWAARTPGVQGNAIKVAIIDKGADVTLTLDSALNTTTVGTQVSTASGSPGGAKSGFIYAWDATTNKVSLITSDTWVATDVIENGVTDAVVSAKSDWYDSQVAYGAVNWASIAPRPGTSPYVAERGGANDEMHIVVYDSTGVITGKPNSLLEKFTFVSKANDAKTQSGAVNYYPTVIINSSQYVYWGSHENDAYDVSANAAISSAANFQGTDNLSNPSTTTFDLFSSDSANRTYTFVKGAEVGSATTGELQTALNEFADTETVDIDYLLMGGGAIAQKSDHKAVATKVLSICSTRKDCVGFISPYYSDVVGVTSSATQTQNVIDFYEGLQATSFGVFDSGWKYIYDRFADRYRYVPLNGDVAGLCASVTANGTPWFSPAGLNRGAIRGAVKLAYSPTKSERDKLYQRRINPVTSLPGQGIVLFGDKTALASPSAFDRINVRRLFNVIEKTIGNAAKGVLFELNDEFTRNNFKNVVEPFLRGIQAERGITDFLVVCDDTNNTGAVIDANEFKADFFIKPARSINFITLTFIATRTGVSFEEVTPRR
ncbi:tail sheath protein [Prochlorococcus phage MED4-213]|uniref:Tail sheath protein n=1 Tax=Prochlorococcus phage MED4-213 TaxID=889956 RepID=M4QD16_9CAUD|nr:tail sheath [Prochlorococcus phage MED4-213]AGH26109.1 tail sheath protein [Prochlorococcus phage MED4-213]